MLFVVFQLSGVVRILTSSVLFTNYVAHGGGGQLMFSAFLLLITEREKLDQNENSVSASVNLAKFCSLTEITKKTVKF